MNSKRFLSRTKSLQEANKMTEKTMEMMVYLQEQWCPLEIHFFFSNSELYTIDP